MGFAGFGYAYKIAHNAADILQHLPRYLLFADDPDNESILVGRDKGEAVTWLPEFVMSSGKNKKSKKVDAKLDGAPHNSQVNATTFNKDKGIGFTRARKPKWAVWIPIRVKAMAAPQETLFVAGPPVFDEKDPLGGFEGRKGGVLRAVSTADGSKRAEYRLDAPPTLDGLIAAGVSLYLTTRDGRLTCWRE
jgi:hypothetical protein